MIGGAYAKEKQAAIVVLDMPLLDTRQGRDLTGTLIADIVLQLLSYVAQTEREFIKRRQAEGIAIAKAKVVHFGPKPMEKPSNYEVCHQAWEKGKFLPEKLFASCMYLIKPFSAGYDRAT